MAPPYFTFTLLYLTVPFSTQRTKRETVWFVGCVQNDPEPAFEPPPPVKLPHCCCFFCFCFFQMDYRLRQHAHTHTPLTNEPLTHPLFLQCLDYTYTLALEGRKQGWRQGRKDGRVEGRMEGRKEGWLAG